MKLCVIGNSHVGMLRAAHRALGDDALDIAYFAKAGGGIGRATIRGPVIAADDPGLRAAQARFDMPEALDVSRFDAVILVAGTLSIYSALAILQDHDVSGWPSTRAPGPGTGPAGGRSPRPARHLVSEPVFVAALADQARDGYGYRFAAALRRATDVPIFLVPQPFPSERVFETARPHEYGFVRARQSGDGPAIATCLRRAIDRAFGALPDVTVLHQEPDTVAHGFTTARRFTRDAVRVDGDTAQHPTDLLHVGPAFGTRVLARVAAELERRAAA